MLRSIPLLAAFAMGCAGSQEAQTDDLFEPESTSAEAPIVIDSGQPSAEAGELEAVAEVAMPRSTAWEVEEAEDVPSFEVEVRPGENLVLLAGWADVSVEDLTELNELDAREYLVVGQEIAIPSPDADSAEAFTIAREAATDLRLERYVARRGGLASTETYTVRTGDTAWGIAHDRAGVPTWVLSRFNRDADLERLSIGDTLEVPVLADTVAEAMDSPGPGAGGDDGEIVDDGEVVMEPEVGPGGLDSVDFDAADVDSHEARIGPAVDPFEFSEDDEPAPEIPLGDGSGSEE